LNRQIEPPVVQSVHWVELFATLHRNSVWPFAAPSGGLERLRKLLLERIVHRTLRVGRKALNIGLVRLFLVLRVVDSMPRRRGIMKLGSSLGLWRRGLAATLPGRHFVGRWGRGLWTARAAGLL